MFLFNMTYLIGYKFVPVIISLYGLRLPSKKILTRIATILSCIVFIVPPEDFFLDNLCAKTVSP